MSDPIVSVEQGQLKGSILKLQDNSTYYSFKGIRYADVPKRFMAPVPPKSWEGVYDATKHGPVCTQYDMMTQRKILGDENCLFLNVYTKSLDTKAKLPVMVFIHGGGYMSGSGNSDTLGPEYILQHDVILVTINYRLEVLGFLCLDTPEVPGNAGLKDQVAALRWVQDNIAQFGGDPNNVTIFGESAGGASVTFHMHSPMSKGLFNKALAQSGVSIHDWAQGTDGRERAIRTAKCLGMDSTDTSKILEFLRSVPAEELSRLTLTSMSEDEKRGGMNICYAPVVEKTFEGVQSFLTETSIDNLHSGQMNKVPLMLGYTSNEGLITFMFENKTEDLNNNPHYVVPKGIKSRVTEEKLKNIGQRIKILYAGDKGFTLDDPQLFADMLSDYYFNFSVQRFANLYHSLAPTYFYVFDCDTELNVVKNLLGFSQLKGACHADDLFYIFSNMLTKDAYNKNQKLKDIVYRVTKLWTNFAKTRFMERFRFPGVVGCIDGTHVAIIRPRDDEEAFFNRKHYHSLNAMIVCDADLNILHVDASYGGACHDSHVWNRSPLNRYMQNINDAGEACWFLGDSGYAQRSYVMTPVLHAAPNTPEAYYTDLHVLARNTVERCIGVLKSRWRCLLAHQTLHYDPVTAGKMVNACIS